MAYNESVYGGANARRGPSPIIWRATQFPTEEVRENPNKGAEFWDDFLSVAGGSVMVAARNSIQAAHPYLFYGGPTTFGAAIPVATGASAGPSVISLAIGAIKLTPLAAAHQNAVMEPGGMGVGTTTTGSEAIETPVGNWGISATPGMPKLAFEAKIQLDAVDATQAFFIGLAEANLSSGINTLFSGADALAQKSFIGFYSVATSAINAAYGKNGAAAVNVGTAGTLVAATYTKLGWRYDPVDSVNGVLSYYQDGVLLGKSSVLPASTAFPSGVALTPCVYIQNAGAGAAARSVTMDWWKVGELLDAAN